MLDKNKSIFKSVLRCVITFILIAVVHVTALFASPAYLGVDYSIKTLIDDFCVNTKNGSSLIMKATMDCNEQVANKILSYKQENDEVLNTVFSTAISNASTGGNDCVLIGSSPYKDSPSYNNFRVYAYTNWNYLNQENYVYIPDYMVAQFVPQGEDVNDYIKGKIVNHEIDITVNGVLYTFKIGGVFNTYLMDEGWRSRGKYFDETYKNCIFINQQFTLDKYDSVFEMFTSDTANSSTTYNNFKHFVEEVEGEIVVPSRFLEYKLMQDLNALKNQKRNSTLQVIIIVVSAIILVGCLVFAIYLFDSIKIWKINRGYFAFIFGAVCFICSCLCVRFTRHIAINFLGFVAYGANIASLNIIAFFLFAFYLGAFIKTYLRIKKDPKENVGVENNKNNEPKQILFITKAKFPDENAFATYISGLASIYKQAGYDVACIGAGYSKYEEISEDYFGKYVSLRKNNKKTFISKVMNQLFLEGRIYDFVKYNFKTPTHIIFSCEFSLSFYDDIKYLFDDLPVTYTYILTEQYTKDEFEKFTMLSRKSLRINNYFVNKYTSQEDSFIVISKYLQSKILQRNMKCTYIPFSFNMEYLKRNSKAPIKHQGINYLYCGNPENKDLLPIVIKAFSSLGDNAIKNNVHFNIVGVDTEWAKNHGIDSYDEKIITFFGKKGKEFVFDIYSKSDYSLLLRDESKVFAKAGFPTKISESMMLGVTPITNLTSNLSDYLNDENAIIIKDASVEGVIDAIEKSISDFKNNELRKKNAMNTAHEVFNIETYKNELLSLIKDKGSL